MKTHVKRSKLNTKLDSCPQDDRANLGVVANSLVITASITEAQALRFTPAGVPALNLTLDHASEMREAGVVRQVVTSLKAMAFGSVAERLARQTIGSRWRFEGFLANATRSKSVVLHIQNFSQDFLPDSI